MAELDDVIAVAFGVDDLLPLLSCPLSITLGGFNSVHLLKFGWGFCGCHSAQEDEASCKKESERYYLYFVRVSDGSKVHLGIRFRVYTGFRSRAPCHAGIVIGVAKLA